MTSDEKVTAIKDLVEKYEKQFKDLTQRSFNELEEYTVNSQIKEPERSEILRQRESLKREHNHLFKCLAQDFVDKVKRIIS